MGHHGIELPRREIAELCRRHHIRKMSLFGSVLREDFGPRSDIDVLVEFEPQATPGFGFMAIQEELSELIGHPVDLHTAASLSKYFRDEVLRGAEVFYDAA